jgi:hypothetical protein
MTTYNTLDYHVVAGTVAGIATFNTNVNLQIAAGYAPVGTPWTDGVNVSQGFAKSTGSAITAAWTISIAPTVGLAGLGAFTIAGADVRTQFPIGFRFTVVGSTANDGIYTVLSAPTFSTNTVIPVEEAVASAVVDGQIIQFAAI